MQPCINESRIRDLERANSDMSRDIKDLIKKLDTLTQVLMKVGYLIGTGVVSFLIYLVIYWVKG
jgi:hypothetical protein